MNQVNLTYRIIAGFLLGISAQLFSQQLPQYTQWSLHQFALNPAHAGIKSCADLHALFRNQWVGFDGAPKSGFFTITAPLKAKRKQYLSARHGIGLKFETDHIGDFSTNRINVAYAGHFNFSRDTRLSLGIYGGIVQTGYDPTNAVTIDPDAAVMNQRSFISPDATFGAWWNGANYYFGFIEQNLFHSKWPDVGTNSYYRFHTIFNGGYRMALNKKTTFLPAFLFKIPPKGPAVLDLQAMLDFNNSINIGLGYRTSDAVLFFFGFKINQQFSLQYSFDMTTSGMKTASSNTHEISISFTTCKRERTSTSSCPLFD